MRRYHSLKDELVRKSRESMLAAVQIYNNPNISFKAENFISLAVIGWTYLMHAYLGTRLLVDQGRVRENGCSIARD